MELIDHVKPEYLRLLRKLNKEGLESVVFLAYENYMRTALWKKIRSWVLDRDCGRCIVCKMKASEVHHRDYREATLIGGASDMLVSLCVSCHEKIEKDESGAKRKDLFEKDVRLSALSSIHADIEKIGMTVELTVCEAHSVSNIAVAYIGPSSFLEFYTLSSLAYSFCLHIMHRHREKLALPMPFRREKLSQKSGAKLLARSDKKPLAFVWATADSIQIKQTKGCPVQIASELLAFIADSKYWRVHGSLTHEF